MQKLAHYHLGCARNIKATACEGNLVICCEKSEINATHLKENDIQWETVSPQLFSYILATKDALIDELRQQIAFLHIQINERKPAPSLTDKKLSSTTDKPSFQPPGDKKTLPPASKETMVKQNGNKDEQDNQNATSLNNNWKKVEHKKSKKRETIVGNANSTDIKTVPRNAYVYVSRLSSETTEADLENFLRKDFPENKCELLKSNFPTTHARFKVTIDFTNLDKSRNPDVWPKGAQISRFFHPRKIINQTG